MAISDESWSPKLRTIGDLERPDHSYLTPSDECYFFGEYTARAGYAHSRANSLITNLKKKPALRSTSQWPHKEQAILDCAAAIVKNLKPEFLSQIVFVPIPPSKCPGSPDYDDRVTRIARAISPNADVREIIFSVADREARHTTQDHRDPNALRSILRIREELVGNARPFVILLDDVVTTGCSFYVCKAMLGKVWPESTVVGIFVARRAIPKTMLPIALEIDR
jgi:predicted amidophosphoribosyltransferase